MFKNDLITLLQGFQGNPEIMLEDEMGLYSPNNVRLIGTETKLKNRLNRIIESKDMSGRKVLLIEISF